MTAFKDLPIKHKLVWLSMLTSSVVLVAAAALLMIVGSLNFRSDLADDLRTLATVTADNSTAALTFSDPEAAMETLAALQANPNILSACLYDQAKVFAQYARDPLSPRCPPGPPAYGTELSSGGMSVSLPVTFEGQRIGTVFVESDLQEAADQLRIQFFTVSAVLVGAMALAYLLSSLLQRVISQPVLDLSRTMKAVSERNDYGVRATRIGNDELGRLVESFNNMLMQIQERDTELRLAKEQLEHRVEERTLELRSQLQKTRETQLELERVNAELMQSNKELDDFAYIASHDLKEPLRGIQNYAEFVLEDEGPAVSAESRTRMQSMIRLAGRMRNLIDELLHYSRVGRTDLVLEIADLNEVLKDVTDSLRIAVAESDVEIRIPKPLPAVLCDRIRVGEIFQNLLTNAMKYNDSPAKWVEVGCQDGQPIVFYVRDNGIGIPSRHLESIFRIFKRLHAQDKYGGGAGAGLTIVRKIVERHHGRIWVESRPGVGTTFYFTLEPDRNDHARQSDTDS
jgi:signal transduction histidine kinase